MILYTLQCGAGHRFESWFPSSASYEAQREKGLVTCPHCGSGEVEKAVMAPSVARTDRKAHPPALAAGAPAPAAAPVPAVASSPESELSALIRQVRDHVAKNADYVGDAFADLARKMHDGEIAHRNIYGEASAEEVKALREDEVEVFPLPPLPEDRN